VHAGRRRSGWASSSRRAAALVARGRGTLRTTIRTGSATGRPGHRWHSFGFLAEVAEANIAPGVGGG